jgi:dephospho-CoA kinase
MIKIGLTGSIGMGKSAVSKMFRRLGVPVFDADAEVHKLQGPGGALVARIEASFPGTTGPKGVDRQKLGAAVLGKPDELRALERIVHPAVYHVRQHCLLRNRSRPMVVLDIP